MDSKQIKSWTIPSIAIILAFVVSANSSPNPLLPSQSSVQSISNQLTGDLRPDQHQGQPQYRQPEQQAQAKQGTQGTSAQFVFQALPGNNNMNNGQFQNQQTGVYQGRENEVAAPASSSPFFALSSSGNFELSAFLSKMFWCLTLPIVSLAVLVFLVRYFFPNASIGGLYNRIKGTPAGRSFDLERVARAVYEGLDSYEKWAGLDLKEVTSAVRDATKSKSH